MNAIIQYLRDTRAELRHVAWPTTQQTVVYTALVVGISIIVAAFTGGVDYLLTTALNWLLQ
jgi:preprotein translocase subunit SecE